MALIGREHELEAINKKALRMAREVADETGTLMAGNISNSNIFVATVPNYREKIMSMFKVITDITQQFRSTNTTPCPVSSLAYRPRSLFW